MKVISSLVMSCALAATAAAQTAAGPVLGWTLVSQGRAVQTLLGVPGASRLGSLSAIPPGIRELKLNPARAVALALDESGAPSILGLDTMQRETLPDARLAPDLAVWSSGGAALALVYRDAQWVQIFALKSGAFRLLNEFRGAAESAAVSDDGSALLAATGAGLGLYENGGAAVVAQGHVVAFTFMTGTHTPAYWRDGRLTIGAQTVPIGDPEESVLLASIAADRLLIVRTASGRATTVDAAGQMLADQDCGCSIVSLEPMAHSGAIRLATTGGGPLWAVDGAEERGLFFIPSESPERGPIRGGVR